MKKNKFVQGILLLGGIGIVSKIVGAVYRVPLTNLLGSEGMGLYQMVFPIFSFLIAISSSGFPASMSKLVAQYNSRGDYNIGKKILSLSLFLLFAFSCVCSMFLWIMGEKIAVFQGNPDAKILYFAISPAIMFVALIAGYRGYFQGFENMLPTSVSMFIEQLAKLIFGLFFARLFFKRGIVFGALGAILGVIVGEVLALVFLLIYHHFFKKKCNIVYKNNKNITNKKLIFQILSLSLPICIGGLVVPICGFVDSALIVNLLEKQGASASQATSMFGLFSGVVGSIVNMPAIFSLAISSAIVPLASRSLSLRNKAKLEKNMSLSFVLTFAVMLPCFVVLFVFGDLIVEFLFGRGLSKDCIFTCSKLLRLGAFTSVLLSFAQVSAGVLQGLGNNFVSVFSLVIGAIVKICLTYLLVGNGFLIFGAEVSSAFCYGVAGIVNLWFILRQYKFVLKTDLLKVIASGFLIFASALIAKKVVLMFSDGGIALMLCLFAVGIVVCSVYCMMYKVEINKFLNGVHKKHSKPVE